MSPASLGVTSTGLVQGRWESQAFQSIVSHINYLLLLSYTTKEVQGLLGGGYFPGSAVALQFGKGKEVADLLVLSFLLKVFMFLLIYF